MFNPDVCLTSDTNSEQLGASETQLATVSDMGNCALCEEKLHESDEAEPLMPDQAPIGTDADGIQDTTTTYMNVPNSYSYPLFYDPAEFAPTFSTPLAYPPRTFTKSCSLSSIAPGLKTNFSPSYLDCRLRYIRQTRRIQKYLRITPEGHVLVNDVRQYARSANPHTNDTHSGQGENMNHLGCDTFHPLSSLISVSKLRRIHAAYWNLESRQDLLRSRSVTVPEIATMESNGKPNCNGKVISSYSDNLINANGGSHID